MVYFWAGGQWETCVFFYFSSNIFHIFYKGLALLLTLNKGITCCVTMKRILFKLTSKHSWLKKETKLSWKKAWVTAQVRNRVGEKPSVEVQFCGHFLCPLSIWKLFMDADCSFYLNKHFCFPTPYKVLVMSWQPHQIVRRCSLVLCDMVEMWSIQLVKSYPSIP